MMENVLFDSNCAEKLNKLVQSRIAPHLFIVCNYNPNTFDTFSEDAKFIKGIANLYKFAIDTSLINKLNTIDKTLGGTIWRKYKQSLKNLNYYLEIISYLRTFAFHNNDHNLTIKKTESWLINTIHKKKFETLGDYTLAIRELERIGHKTYEVVTNILNNMVKEYPRNELRDVFQEQIFLFLNNDKKRLFKEELRAAYMAKSTRIGDVKDPSLAAWCQKMYVGKLEESIKYLSSYLSKTNGTTRQKFENKIKQNEEEINAIKKKIAKKSENCKGNIRQLRSYDYMDFYFDSLADKCKKELSSITKQNLTMLPQDMIQFFISNDFREVSVDAF